MSAHISVTVSTLIAATLLSICAYAQNDPNSTRAPGDFPRPDALLNPLSDGVQPEPIQPNMFVPRPNGCITHWYFNASSATISVQDTVPTKVWAVRMNITDLDWVKYCTLWTVETNFRWTPQSPGTMDTLHIFMREVTPPYALIYHSKYLTRLGENVGGIEVDPPLPGDAAPILKTIRDVFVGIYITGKSGSSVTWRMKPPSNPNHSYIFLTPQNPVSPGSVFGTNGELILSAIFCGYWIPVELSLFTGYTQDGEVHLEWVTESETNSYQFEVQRKTQADGVWETRGTVSAQGNSQTRVRYAFTDRMDGDLPETCWYRLRQTDFDGLYEYFGPVRVESKGAATGYALQSVYPNPVGASAAIRYELPAESHVRITVVDALGRETAELRQGLTPAGTHELQWYPAAALANGVYYVVMRTASHSEMQRIHLVR